MYEKALKTCKIYLEDFANANLRIIVEYNQKKQKIERQDFISIKRVKN